MTMPTEEQITAEIEARLKANRQGTPEQAEIVTNEVLEEVSAAIDAGTDPLAKFASLTVRPGQNADDVFYPGGDEDEPTEEIMEGESPFPSVEASDWPDVALANAEVSFVMRVSNTDDLGEVMDVAAINLARYGMDAMTVLVSDLDSDRQWIVRNGEIRDATDLAATLDGE